MLDMVSYWCAIVTLSLRRNVFSRYSTCNYFTVYCTVNVRLAGSNLRQEGRLEVQYNGTWGTVTSDSFASAEAKVFCAAMGFG